MGLDEMNNSKKAQTAQEPKKIEPVVKGPVTLKKPSAMARLKNKFLAGDAKQTADYVGSNVVVPGVKQLLLNTLTNGLSMLIMGTAGRQQNTYNNGNYYGGRSYPYYASYMQNIPQQPQQPPPPKNYGVADYNNIVFSSYSDADQALSTMIDILERYQWVSINDYYELAGLTAPFTSVNYGWNDLSNTHIVPANGGYVLTLPRPITK